MGYFQLRFPWNKGASDTNEFRPENLPKVPLLVNHKTIEQHQRLVCFYEKPKREEEGEPKVPEKKKSRTDPVA